MGKVTVDGYVKIIKKFLRGIDCVYPDKERILDYILVIHNKQQSYSHIRNTTNGIEWYMRFLNNPINLTKPKKPRRLIREYLKKDEVREIIACCKNQREKAITSTLAYSGIRIKELCALRAADIDPSERTILIRDGKGSQDRIIYIPSRCANVLKGYIKKEKMLPEEHIFKSQPCVIRRTIKRIARRTTIKKNVYPHIFRHSLAMNLLINGCDLISIQKQLGHRNIQTTLIYVHSTPELLKNAYDKYCPRY